MFDYNWPGNVRELENTIERCLILSDTNQINIDSLPIQISGSDDKSMVALDGPLFSENAPIIPFEQLKMNAIQHAVQKTEGSIVEAAKKLQIGRATLYRLMEKYNINTKSDSTNS